MRRHGRNGEQPADGATETTTNPEDSQRPYTESNNVMRGTLHSEKVDKATTICRGHFENSAACTTKLHEFNRRQNVSADANDASNYVASTPVTGADRLHTTPTSPDASDASPSISRQSSSSDASSPEDTNESDEVAADSEVHSNESAPDASNLPEVPTVAGVVKSTESSTETSQSPQFLLAFDPDEVAGVVPDETDTYASGETSSPPLNDATAENDTRGGGLVEQRELVDVSSVSADDFNENYTDLSSTEVDFSASSSVQSDTTDYGNTSDSSESTPGASDEPFSSTLTWTDSETMSLTEHTFTDDLFNATLSEIDSETISFTERIASDESLDATLAVTVSDTISLDELIVSDEPSDATLIVTESSSMLFFEEITEVPANSSETDGNSTDGSEPTTIPLTTDSDDHSEWQTEVNLTNISSEVMTAEIATGMTPDMTTDMTTTTLRTRKTRKSRKPITDKTRKPLPYSRHKVPNEKSLVCAITEDFSSYWLSFGFPFRYADVYPDHLCTHYIFSPLVFNEFNDTDFSLYPHNFCESSLYTRRQSAARNEFYGIDPPW
ncbi:uncharacterized protein LOC142814520 [Rhipicephalus microplus]|uniref:uncharacterized protein LOC142814520 n=1 Tax=Rhipicephalus microplus TaxID=6941 RepID=UPI003F6B0677